MYIFFPSRFGLGMTFVQEKKKFTHSNTKTKPLWVFCQKKKKKKFSRLKEWASQAPLVVKNPPANAGDRRPGFDPWVRKNPWRKTWQPTPVFLPGESQGQRGLESYSP